MLSLLSVNYNTLDWAKLLVQSIRKFTASPYELIVVDNASVDGSREWLAEQKDVNYPGLKPRASRAGSEASSQGLKYNYRQLREESQGQFIKLISLDKNIGHGKGLDLALENASSEWCVVLDIDTHIQREGWETDLLSLYKSDYRIRLIAAKGGNPDDVPPKPIHACWMFFETKFFKDNNLSFIARDGYDVGRKIYYDITGMGHKVLRIGAGYEPDGQKFYPGTFGTEYYIGGRPTLFHHWYASRMWHKAQVDGYRLEDFEKHKALLFSMPLVREILAWRK